MQFNHESEKYFANSHIIITAIIAIIIIIIH